MKRPQNISPEIIAAVSAGFNVSVTETITADHLRYIRDAHAQTVKILDDAIEKMEQRDTRRAEVHQLVTQSKADHAAKCVNLARLNRRASVKACAASVGLSASDTRRLLAAGRAECKKRATIAKRSKIVSMAADGLGVRVISRALCHLPGGCSPALVSRTLKAARETAQARLPFPLVVVK